MTLAAGFKFEHPKAQGISPILLLSDSRYSYPNDKQPPDDLGMKVSALAFNIHTVFAGNVLDAKNAIDQVKECLTLQSSGNFEDIREILKYSFDSTITIWDEQTPHCLLGAISPKGDSRLFYAKPDIKNRSYHVSERLQAFIGDRKLGPKLQERIDAPKPRGLYHPKHFMCLSDDRLGYDPKKQAVDDAKEISKYIGMAFLETVDDPSVKTAKSPLQGVLLLPSKPLRLNLWDIALSSTQFTRKTRGPNEVHWPKL